MVLLKLICNEDRRSVFSLRLQRPADGEISGRIVRPPACGVQLVKAVRPRAMSHFDYRTLAASHGQHTYKICLERG